MQVGAIFTPEMGVRAYQSTLGWIVAGSSRNQSATTNSSISPHNCAKDREASYQMYCFRELEEPPHDKPLTQEEQKAMEHFKVTHSRESDGRYVVSLPCRELPLFLGCSKDQAVRQFLLNEKNLTMRSSWNTFSDNMQTVGHAETVR